MVGILYCNYGNELQVYPVRCGLYGTDDGARNFKRSVAGGEQCLEVTQRFVPTEDEAIYGLGQYQNGIMNYRGKSVLLLQANMDIVNPFLISTNGYGVLWDNYSSTKFEDTKEGYSFTSEVGDASDYYFVYGKNMDEVLRSAGEPRLSQRPGVPHLRLRHGHRAVHPDPFAGQRPAAVHRRCHPAQCAGTGRRLGTV